MLDVIRAINQNKYELGHIKWCCGVPLNKVDRNKDKQFTFSSPKVHLDHFSHSVVSDSLWPHGLQHARLAYPSPTPRAYSNSCPSSQWCHPTISASVIPFSSCLQSFQATRSFPISWLFQIRLPKYWSFSFSASPSNEYSGLISFRMDWFDLQDGHSKINCISVTNKLKIK